MSGPPVPQLQSGSNAIGLFQTGVSPIGDIPAFSFWSTIISQYANSPILTTLIQNWFNYIDQTQDLDAFFDNIMSIDTAVGYGLDLWGRILGVSRVLTVSASPNFGFASQAPSVTGFNQAPFFTGQLSTSNFTLSDASYRTLLIAKALANITDSTIPSLNAILRTLFPGRGNAFVTDVVPTSNLLLQSNTFTSGVYANNGPVTLTPNVTLSPDGTVDAWLWQRTVSTVSYLLQSVTIPITTNPVPYTFSVDAKASTGRYLALFIDDGAGVNTVEATFDLQLGVLSNGPVIGGNAVFVAASIVLVANGFYRCSVTMMSNKSGLLRAAFSCNSNNSILINSDSSSTSSMFAFGAQLEQNSAPNTYVPTTGSPASQSGTNMTMTYTFNFVLSPVEQSIVVSSGVLPKPAGVALSIVQI